MECSIFIIINLINAKCVRGIHDVHLTTAGLIRLIVCLHRLLPSFAQLSNALHLVPCVDANSRCWVWDPKSPLVARIITYRNEAREKRVPLFQLGRHNMGPSQLLSQLIVGQICRRNVLLVIDLAWNLAHCCSLQRFLDIGTFRILSRAEMAAILRNRRISVVRDLGFMWIQPYLLIEEAYGHWFYSTKCLL